MYAHKCSALIVLRVLFIIEVMSCKVDPKWIQGWVNLCTISYYLWSQPTCCYWLWQQKNHMPKRVPYQLILSPQIKQRGYPQQHQLSWSRSSNRVKGDVKIGSMQSSPLSPLSCRIEHESKSFSVQQWALPILKSTCKTLDTQLHRTSKNDISGHTRRVFLQHKQKPPRQLIA